MLIINKIMILALIGIIFGMSISYYIQFKAGLLNIGSHISSLLWIVFIGAFLWMQINQYKQVKQAQAFVDGKTDMEALMDKFKDDKA